MYKIDKTLIDNMNLNRSCIVITPKETIRREEKSSDHVMSVEDEEQIPAAVREKARIFIQNANEKARQTLQSAQAQAEQIKEEARSEGYAAGIAEGRQQAAAEMKAKNDEVKDVLSRIEAYRQKLYQTLESDILSLSMDVAEKIINIHLERDDKVFRGIVKKAVASIKHTDEFSLYVSKDEYDRYFKEGAKWLREETKCGPVEVVSDGNLPKGSCMIEADSEIVDAGVPTQMGKIRQFLSEKVE